ncbi:hypothetical protein [Vibrio alginolyticus]|uniref:hypothetical protein n=1 Tax=Vibrio alginolyticus TaxID=663 RepID=UPI0028066A64|nr:hypothetical protein [Vibrio alginolyticus]
MAINERDDIDLSLVVDSIKQASDRELKILSEISKKLDAPVVSSGLISPSHTASSEEVSAPQSAPKQRKRPVRRTAAKKRPGEVTAQLAKKQKPPAQEDTEHLKQTEALDTTLPMPSTGLELMQQQPKEAESVEKRELPVSAATQVQQSKQNAPELPAVSVNVDAPESDTSNIEKAIRDGLSEFDDFWKDEKGRLRRANGTYASKEENARYQKTAEDIAKERETEKQTSALARVVGTFRTAVDIGHDTANNDAADAAGAAAGGSWFYAAKELYTVGENILEGADNLKEKTSDLKEQWQSNKAFSFAKFFSKDKEAQEAFTSSEQTDTASQSSALLEQSSGPASVTNTISETASRESSKSSQQNANLSRLETRKSRFFESFGSLLGGVNGRDTLTERVSTSNNDSSSSVVANTVDKQSSTTQTSSLLAETKRQSSQENQRELIQEQTQEQKESNAEIISLLDDISSNTKGESTGLLSELSDIGSLFEGRGRKGRGGRRGGLFGKERASSKVSIGRPEKASRFKSVLNATGKKGAGIAAGGMSMAGTAFKGVSTLAKGAGKAIPLLAPMLAAYDAYSGFTDKEAQKETFNLKEGEEATTGQKAAMAAGSLLDMGGLVSGAAGLAGDALGALGFDGAKDALTFEAGDIAKGIYELFTGKSSSDKQTSTSSESVTSSNESQTSASSVTSANSSESATSYQSDVDQLVAQGVPLAKAEELAKQKAQEQASNATASKTDVVPANQMRVDGMQVATVSAIGNPVTGSKESKATSTKEYVSDQAVSNSSDNATSVKELGSLESMQSVESAQATSGVSKVISNQSASSVYAELAQKELQKSGKPNVIQLDKKSVEDLAKGIKKANSETSTTTVVQASPAIQKGRGPKPAATNNPGTGSIPNNFNDRSLQRQSADLE